jgi:hypothetical protein
LPSCGALAALAQSIDPGGIADAPNGRGRAIFVNGRIYEGPSNDGCFRQGSALAALGTARQARGFK